MAAGDLAMQPARTLIAMAGIDLVIPQYSNCLYLLTVCGGWSHESPGVFWMDLLMALKISKMTYEMHSESIIFV